MINLSFEKLVCLPEPVKKPVAGFQPPKSPEVTPADAHFQSELHGVPDHKKRAAASQLDAFL